MRVFPTTLPCLALAALAALVGVQGCSYPHLYEKGRIDEDYFQRVAKNTAVTRGIEFASPVPHDVISTEEAKKKIAADVDRDLKPADEKSQIQAWEALGFVEGGGEARSLAKDLVDLTAEQAAAFYDPREKHFYVSGVTDQARGVSTGLASWALDRDLVSEIVFSHELVHALQDQKYDLQKYDEGAEGNDDAELARRAVVEGDATFYGFQSLGLGAGGVELKREDMQDAGGEAWEHVPPILREELAFAYWAGNAFHRAIRKGAETKLERDPFLDAPASTSEILHPEKYKAHWKPVEVVLGDAPLPRGVSLVRENTVGEFALRVLLEGRKKSAKRAEKASKGWRGDRYRVYRTPRVLVTAEKDEPPVAVELALAWRLEFDSAEDASAFVDAYKRFSKKKPVSHEASICALAGERGAIVVEAPDGATLAALLPVALGK